MQGFELLTNMPTRKKKVIKLKNKTNEGLFIELDDDNNIKRDDSKIRSVHIISAAEEVELYNKIGLEYKPSSHKKRLPPPKVDLEQEEEQPNTLPIETKPQEPVVVERPRAKSLLHNAGIS